MKLILSGVWSRTKNHFISITTNDVLQVAAVVKASAKIIAVHIEAINHCYLSRTNPENELANRAMAGKCFKPGDGEAVSLPF